MNNHIKKISVFFALLLVLVIAFPLAKAQLDVLEGSLLGEDGINDITLTYNSADFSDGQDNITLAFSHNGVSFDLGANGSQVVTLTVTIPSDMDLDRYTGTVTVTGINDANLSETFKDTFTLTIDVRPTDLCKDGRVGDKVLGRVNNDELNIDDIDDPNEDDNFKPLETIDVGVNVDNDADEDLEVEFKAFLVDKEDDDVLAEFTDVADIDENDDLDFDGSLIVPADIEDESTSRYAVYVMASEDGNEDDYCDWEQIDIEIEKDNDDVVVDKVIPQEPLVCGVSSEIEARIVNAGGDDQRDVSVKLFINDLKIALTSAEFDLDKKDTQKVLFDLSLPKTIAAGTYSGRVEVLDEDGAVYDRNEARKEFQVTVECGTQSGGTGGKVNAALSLSQSSFTARKDSAITTIATIKNTGDSAKTFILRVTPVGDWTEPVEISFSLAAGETQIESIALAVEKEGNHVAKVEVLADGQVVATQTFTVDAKEVVSGTGSQDGGITARTVSTAFKEQLPLVILISLLALAVMILLIWLIASSLVKRAKGNGRGLREIKEGVKGKRR
ncbi:putative S-layer protein [Candidatus Pacearchaeota archaeon]|nr:putative S-layer protein [Candidatus Pacearchaeota archaeon]